MAVFSLPHLAVYVEDWLVRIVQYIREIYFTGSLTLS